MSGGLHISLAAERVGSLFGLPITNTLVTEWVVIVFLLIVGIVVGRNPQLIPGKIQNFFEMLFEFVLNYMEETFGSRDLAERFFPLIITIFLFVLTSNFFDFLPIVGSIGFTQQGQFVPLFRPVNTDLNVTLALAIVAYLVIEITGIVMLGFLKYGSKFVNFKTGVIGFFIGLMELISNTARLISFSFRLFGNIFAGTVLIAVISLFIPLILPVPLLIFETFVAVVQAVVFALLTLVFVKVAISEPH